MKKTGMILLVLVLAAAAAPAQPMSAHYTFGGGYFLYDYNEDLGGGITGTTSFQGWGIAFSSFLGEDLGLFQRLTVGLASKAKIALSDGTSSAASEWQDLAGSLICQSFMIGPGYETPLGNSLSLLGSVGVGYTAAIDLDGSFGIALMSLGLGANAELSFAVTESFALTAALGMNYDFTQLISSASAPFVSAFEITPYVGFQF